MIAVGGFSDILCCVINYSTDKFFVEGTVIYTLKDDRELDAIPLCSVYDLDPGTNLIKFYRAYMDLNPLFLALGNDITLDETGKPKFVP